MDGIAVTAANTLDTGLSGGEVWSLCILGWIFRGRAMATDTALFGPWPDSSVLLTEVILIVVSYSAAGLWLGGVVVANCPQRQEEGCVCYRVFASELLGGPGGGPRTVDLVKRRRNRPIS